MSEIINVDKNEAVATFRAFLRVATVSSTGVASGAYAEAVTMLKTLLDARMKGAKWTSRTVELVKGKPILVGTWRGADEALPAVLLNCHYDVVPVFEEHWERDPFGAEMDEKTGDIYARGAQDMKSVCMQYVWALIRLREAGVELRRTVHVTFMPDEEIGGKDGMGEFVKSEEFKKLRVGVCLDEGLANPTDKMTCFYSERAVWWLMVRATGNTGHASRFIEGTAMGKLVRSINQFLEFREQQRQRLHAGCQHAHAKKLGDVVTLNLTALKAGATSDHGETFALNVVPNEAYAGFDMRIPPSVPLEEMERKLDEWTKEEGVSYEFVNKVPKHAVSPLDGNKFWEALVGACKEHGVEIEAEVFSAATDGRYIRALDVPTYGFSPMNREPILLHDHNEKINVQTYLKGIDMYETIITKIANLT